jgi:hypothetical protein
MQFNQLFKIMQVDEFLEVTLNNKSPKGLLLLVGIN